MKVFIVLASFIALASAGHLHQLAGRAAIATGTSSQFRSEDNYGNSQYGYDIQSADGGSSRREEEINGVRRGMYSLRDADGRQRIVHYVADASGFHADIQTNEPGVEAKDPADVLINHQGVGPVAAPVAFAAPAPIAAPLPAPIAAPAAFAAPARFAAPAQFAVKGAYAPRQAYAAPAPIAIAAPEVIEAPTPKAFSYSFGSTHAAPAYAAPAYAAPAPIAAPAPVLAAPEPVFQQRLEY